MPAKSNTIPIDVHIFVDDENQVIVTDDESDDRIENLNPEKGHLVVHMDIPKHLVTPVRVTVPPEVFGESDTRIIKKVVKAKAPGQDRMEMVIAEEEDTVTTTEKEGYD